MKDTQDYSDNVYSYLERIEAHKHKVNRLAGFYLSRRCMKVWVCWDIWFLNSISSLSPAYCIRFFALQLVDAIEAESDWRFVRGVSHLRVSNRWRSWHPDEAERSWRDESDEALSLLSAIANTMEEM